ncbi:MAG TPA: response regulator [Jatrophihabitans sp.]|jgi:DNA-binding response OmpR family regulator
MPGEPTAVVVDDDEGILALVSAILCRAGYTVRAFAEPYGALLAAHERPPDVYILDVRLPAMNGRDLCRVLKAVERTRRPVLMMSAESSRVDIAKALDAGGDDFLAKPFRRTELVTRVDELRI